jgi:hypothetical protein
MQGYPLKFSPFDKNHDLTLDIPTPPIDCQAPLCCGPAYSYWPPYIQRRPPPSLRSFLPGIRRANTPKVFQPKTNSFPVRHAAVTFTCHLPTLSPCPCPHMASV